MGWYILKLLLILPLMGLMIWGTLKLINKMQGKFGSPAQGPRTVRVIETMAISPTQRLAVLAFHDREILVAHGRGGLTRLAEAPARPADLAAAEAVSEAGTSAGTSASGFAAQLKSRIGSPARGSNPQGDGS